MDAFAGNDDPIRASQFPGTRWSIVLQIQDGDIRQAENALEEICARYWYPIYTFLRKQGHPMMEAEDLTQGFFQRLLTQGTLNRAREERGRLRTFLLADLKRYLIDVARKEMALKRGGGRKAIPIDEVEAEARYQESFVQSGGDPEWLFEKAWANDLVRGVMEKLAKKYEKSGKKPLFDAMRDSLYGGDVGATYGELASFLGLSPGALRLQVMRLRRAFSDQLKAEIAETVETAQEIDDELRHLIRLLRS